MAKYRRMKESTRVEKIYFEVKRGWCQVSLLLITTSVARTHFLNSKPQFPHAKIQLVIASALWIYGAKEMS